MTRGTIRSGVLNVDKPPGLTSHDVVVAVRKMARQRKVGHAGTLDPLATGVLLVCLGQATRISEYLMRTTKTYRATVRLGVSTTTHDADGEVTAEAPVSVSLEDVERALGRLVGHIQQVPPRYSAVKRDGKRLYELARQGIAVDAPPREVRIDELTVADWAPPVFQLDVRCGPGTYVRAVARDLGMALGCGAHLEALRRLSSGSFVASDAVSLPELEAAFSAEASDPFLYPMDAALGHLGAVQFSQEEARRLAMGQSVVAAVDAADETLVRAYAPGDQFVALAYWDERAGAWRPRKVFVHPAELTPDARTDDRDR